MNPKKLTQPKHYFYLKAAVLFYRVLYLFVGPEIESEKLHSIYKISNKIKWQI